MGENISMMAIYVIDDVNTSGSFFFRNNKIRLPIMHLKVNDKKLYTAAILGMGNSKLFTHLKFCASSITIYLKLLSGS